MYGLIDTYTFIGVWYINKSTYMLIFNMELNQIANKKDITG